MAGVSCDQAITDYAPTSAKWLLVQVLLQQPVANGLKYQSDDIEHFEMTLDPKINPDVDSRVLMLHQKIAK